MRTTLPRPAGSRDFIDIYNSEIMSDLFEGPSKFTRRAVAMGALVGGASLAFGLPDHAHGAVGSAGGLLNVRGFGAKGDGIAVDTKAIQSAIDAAAEKKSAVFIPPGVYLCSEIHLPHNVSLLGIPAWDYHNPGGSVLKLVDEKASCLLNITDAWGATIDGLSLEGEALGKGIHGIFLNKPVFRHEDALRIERCRIAHFTGDGINLTRAWAFSVRHSMSALNQGDGLNLRGVDGFLMDNWFSGNGGAGFGARVEEENAAITMTGNRFEWNRENIFSVGGQSYNITGNYIDRAGNRGIALLPGPRSRCPEQITITGNYFYRSGKDAAPGSYESSHLHIEGAKGIACVGNCFHRGRDDFFRGVWSPSYGIVYKGLENSVITNNVLHQGALKALMVDLGGHGEGVIVKDNPGNLFIPSVSHFED
jgi:hypothetical protein